MNVKVIQIKMLTNRQFPVKQIIDTDILIIKKYLVIGCSLLSYYN